MESTIITPDFSRVPPEIPVSPKEMITVVKDGNQTFVRINSSSLNIIQVCSRKAKYQLHDKLRPKNGSPPLVYGSAIHKALDVFYSYDSKERDLPDNFDEVASTLSELNAKAPSDHFLYRAIETFVKAAEPLRVLPDTDKRSVSSGVWVLTHYFKTYLHDHYTIHRDEKGPLVERTFSIPYYENSKLKIELFGTIDFVLKNQATGEILVGDHKTSSYLGQDFFNRIKPNHQYTAYLIGAHKSFGTSSEHFLVNGIQSKARPIRNAGPPTFARQITRRTPDDFLEFKEVLIESVMNYLRWAETDVWPLGPVDACANYGSCTYLDVCSQPRELRETIIENKFIKA